MKNLLFVMIWFNSSLALAQQKGQPLNEVESILDQLEKRLKEHELEVVKAPTGDSSGAASKSDKALRFESKKIEANVGSSQKLHSISEALGKLEDDIDRIDAEVHLARQTLLESAKIDNMIEIEGTIQDPDKLALRSLVVSIDGYKVYVLNDSNGLWVPSKSIPIYSGPMSPGKHKLVVESRVSTKTTDHFPFVNSDFKVVNKSIDIDIPDGSFKKSWSIDLGSKESKKYAQVDESSLEDEMPTNSEKDEE